MTTMRITDTYHPSVNRVNDNLIEFTIQYTTKGASSLQKAPPGGYYGAALNVKRVGRDRTELAWYSPSHGWKDEWVKIKEWATGKRSSCD